VEDGGKIKKVGSHIKKTDRRRSKRENIDIDLGGHPTSNPANQFWNGEERRRKMKIFLLIFSIFLAGCQQNGNGQKTEWELGYRAGEQDMIENFWKLLDKESDMWDSWKTEAENVKAQTETSKTTSMAMLAGGAFVLALSLFLSNILRKKLVTEKEIAENELEKLKVERDAIEKTVQEVNAKAAASEDVERRLRDLKKQTKTVQEEIERLRTIKEKAELEYQEARKRIDEITI
jgi:hypothetical protein